MTLESEYIEFMHWQYDKNANKALIPHCDQLVLHKNTGNAETDCKYCNDRPDLQQWRIDHGMNFTGDYREDLAPDLATQHRTQEVINRWGGNQIHDQDRELAMRAYYDELEKALNAIR